ncbi:MAG: NAD(P)/FAD-dependent oxidoreductase [bacterium]
MENQEQTSSARYDVAVIGGGPSGLTAGTHCALKGLRTVVFECQTWGGIPTRLCPRKDIEYYPGKTRKVSGEQLARTWLNGARETGVEMRFERVLRIWPDRTIRTEQGVYAASTLILATGSRPVPLGVPGEAKYARTGKGVSYSVLDPKGFAGKRVMVVGGGDSAVDAAASLVRTAGHVSLVHRGPALRATTPARKKLDHASNFELLLGTHLVRILGGERVERVRLRRGEAMGPKEDEAFEMDADEVVLAVGTVPASEMYRELGVDLDEKGHVRTDRAQRTGLEGILAAGDLASDVEMIVVALAQGAIAAHHAYTHLRRPYWAR